MMQHHLSIVSYMGAYMYDLKFHSHCYKFSTVSS